MHPICYNLLCVSKNAPNLASCSFDKTNTDQFLPARCSKCGICYGDVAGWVGVCPSHTFVLIHICIKTAKPILKLCRPSGSPITLVSSDPCADTQFQVEPLQRGVKYTDGGDKMAIFYGNCSISRKRCEIGRWLLGNVNRKSWVPD